MIRVLKQPVLRLLIVLGFGFELMLLSTCSPPISKLEQVRQLGVLRVVTLNSPTTYYESAEGPTGFSFELAGRFAKSLGVELDIRIVDSTDAALRAVSAQKVHMAAANLSITEIRARNIMFTPAVRQVTPQLVYHVGNGRPRSLADLKKPITVVANSAHAELLTEVQKDHPDLRWEAVTDVSAEELLFAVGEGKIAYSVGDSDLIAMTARYHPRLGTAFDLSEPVRKGWAFRQYRDVSLFNEAVRFLTESRGSGRLARLDDRYFGHVDRLDFVSSRTLAQHMKERLPEFRKLFEQAGQSVGIDWRLLAAISYQESHWDPKARSPTGVRGLMMLTRDTAKFMGVANRVNPEQSIDGGGRYFRYLLDQIPDEVQAPDRVWMALAAYNLGLGHLNDVRELTRMRGGDPSSWVDVRANLPLLMQERWFRQTRHGYARGKEAEVYVGNVRTYLDVLMWMTRGTDEIKPEDLAKPRDKDTPRIIGPSPLEIDLPVL